MMRGRREAAAARRRASSGLFTAAAVLCLLLVVPASAKAAETAASGPIEVQVWPEEVPGGAVVIIATELDAAAKLPATVRLPLPDGLNVDWAGEISPSDPASDVARTYAIKDGPDGRYVEFEVVEFREAQIDLSLLPLAVDGGSSKVVLPYVQSVPASETGFSVRIPAGTRLAKSSPKAQGRPSTNAAGESLYALETQQLAAGDVVEVSIEYRREQPATPASRTDTLLIVLAAAAVVAFAVLLAVLGRQRAGATRNIES